MILGDSTYSRIKTEDVFKGKPGEPIVEKTTFGWIIPGGDHVTDGCLLTRETSDYEQLYSLDIGSRKLGRKLAVGRAHRVCKKHFKKGRWMIRSQCSLDSWTEIGRDKRNAKQASDYRELRRSWSKT